MAYIICRGCTAASLGFTIVFPADGSQRNNIVYLESEIDERLVVSVLFFFSHSVNVYAAGLIFDCEVSVSRVRDIGYGSCQFVPCVGAYFCCEEFFYGRFNELARLRVFRVDNYRVDIDGNLDTVCKERTPQVCPVVL